MDFIAIAETLEAQAAALRRHAATLANEGQAALPLAEPQEHPWNDWMGGDGPPAEARGKYVDIVFGSGWTETGVPADVYNWSHVDADDIHFHEIKRYRIAAEQPDA